MARKPFNPDFALGGSASSQPATSKTEPLTVWELTERVRDALEECLPKTVHVVGQLSNAKRHSSGHFYFTLKDDRSELACVMWRSDAARLRFDPQDGLDVVATGSVGVFERAGRYQLYARRLEPRGVGALELAFRQLCEKLKAEGLFDADRKKPLPRYPQRIAVLTSPTGAAVRDVLDTLGRRYPCGIVYLYPVPVQGSGAAEAIARAIRDVNRRSDALGGIDVMIVGRGGGSIEDLWAFNEEPVARAIFASAIPVVSAVGHETDVTVADLVADVRAATPTAAAELVAPHVQDVLDELAYREDSVLRMVRHRVELARSRVATLAAQPMLSDPGGFVRDRVQFVRRLDQQMRSQFGDRLHRLQRRVGELAMIAQRLHPQRVLSERGRRLAAATHALQWARAGRVDVMTRRIAAAEQRLLRLAPAARLEACGERLAGVRRRLTLLVGQRLRLRRERLAAVEERLTALSHETTLARGFSITRSDKTGRLIRSCGDLREGDRIVTQLRDGSFDARVIDANQSELFD